MDDDTNIARASLNQIRLAADKLILDCVARSDSRGGIATGIGSSIQITFDTKLISRNAPGLMLRCQVETIN